MKYITGLFVAALIVASLQSCKKERSAEEIATAEQAKADSIERVRVEQQTARRAELEKTVTLKTERRTKAMQLKLSKGVSYKDAKGNVVYLKPEEMPTYAGGESALRDYLHDNIKYPEQARNDGKEGTVFVDFVVDKNGKVVDVVGSDSVNTDLDPAFVEESVRVVSTMPAWVPAKQKGKPVATAYSIPIKFEIE